MSIDGPDWAELASQNERLVEPAEPHLRASDRHRPAAAARSAGGRHAAAGLVASGVPGGPGGQDGMRAGRPRGGSWAVQSLAARTRRWRTPRASSGSGATLP